MGPRLPGNHGWQSGLGWRQAGAPSSDSLDPCQQGGSVGQIEQVVVF